MIPSQRTSNNKQQDDRICEQYLKLCEKSSLLFSQLYETSFLGEGWRPLYQRTFTTFAKLWKLQQTYRGVLENGKVKFKRFDVGEIAAKIAQLYYHYYLRTSETQFLNEALTYYQEIKKHNYYKEDSVIQRSFVLQRTLRFHARFLLVCLLTDKIKMSENVLSDFALTSAQLATEKLIQPNFQSHQLLAEEMKYIVMNIVNFLIPSREGRLSFATLGRVQPQLIFNTKPKNLQGKTGLKMYSALLLDNKPNNFSFSELSLSILRMIYALEFNFKSMAPEQINEWKNPRKYLLRNVSIPKTLNHIGSTFCDMPSNSFMLLYLSSTVHDDAVNGYISTDGLFMSSYGNQHHILHPEDILPFLRKPMLLIVDTDKQNSFASLTQKHFDVPHLILFGPVGGWQLHNCPLPTDSIFTKTQGKYIQVFNNKKIQFSIYS
ncbi:Protein SCAI [Entamoeba marina]